VTAGSAREAVQWLYFGYLAAVKEQNGAAMSLGRTSTFLDVYLQRDLDAGRITALRIYMSMDELLVSSDVISIHTPGTKETRHLINRKTLIRMKRSVLLVNTARGKICDRDAVVRALESGQLAGYAGDVWFPQPAPKDHPWRTMPHHGMTPHVSGTSLSAQTRYAAGTREILECYFAGKPIRNEYLIVQGGQLAGVGAHSYSAGNATGGSEEAAKFKR